MVIVWRPGYRIDSRTIKGGSQVSSLIVLFVESSNHCILASSFLILICIFYFEVLELVVIFVTSSSTSKTDFICFFYCVFGVGGFTGLIRGRVLTIFLWAFSHLLLIDISINIVLAHVVSFPTNLVSLNSESVCRSCGSFGFLSRQQRYYRRYFFLPPRSGTTTATSAPDQNLMLSPAGVGTDEFF